MPNNAEKILNIFNAEDIAALQKFVENNLSAEKFNEQIAPSNKDYKNIFHTFCLLFIEIAFRYKQIIMGQKPPYHSLATEQKAVMLKKLDPKQTAFRDLVRTNLVPSLKQMLPTIYQPGGRINKFIDSISSVTELEKISANINDDGVKNLVNTFIKQLPSMISDQISSQLFRSSKEEKNEYEPDSEPEPEFDSEPVVALFGTDLDEDDDTAADDCSIYRPPLSTKAWSERNAYPVIHPPEKNESEVNKPNELATTERKPYFNFKKETNSPFWRSRHVPLDSKGVSEFINKSSDVHIDNPPIKTPTVG